MLLCELTQITIITSVFECDISNIAVNIACILHKDVKTDHTYQHHTCSNGAFHLSWNPTPTPPQWISNSEIQRTLKNPNYKIQDWCIC